MLRDEWLRARKRLLNQVRSQVRHLSGPLSADLQEYLKAYNREFRSKWEVCSLQVFHKELTETRLVLGGDFHAFSQAQRLHLRILRDLQRPLVLALECFESRSQKRIDEFLADEISEEEFIKKIGWEKRWGFPWENYSPLLAWAKKQGVPVIGLNRYEAKRDYASLERRDAHAAQKIKSTIKKYPEHLVYVIFGDLHLAQGHLPLALEEALGFDPKPLILMQNPEELYFRMARKGLEGQVEWLRASRRRFCHISSPPWVKWQSYLMFLEHNFDRGLQDSEEELDLTDQLGSLVVFLCRDLNVHVSVDELAVYSPGQLSVENLMTKPLSKSERAIALRLIQEDRSFYIPEQGLVYLSRLSINHAAALAGRFIHSQLSGCRRLFWDQPRDFHQAIWIEAVGFFFSKLINHRRKAESLRSLKARMMALDSADFTKQALQIALDQRMLETVFVHTNRLRPLRNISKRPWVYLEAARILGEMMGEKLYMGYRMQRFGRRDLVKWLSADLEESQFESMYMKLVKRLESLRPVVLEEKSGAASW